jgi:hypothetical protein
LEIVITAKYTNKYGKSKARHIHLRNPGRRSPGVGIYQPTTGNADGQLPGDWESVAEIFTLEADKILKI